MPGFYAHFDFGHKKPDAIAWARCLILDASMGLAYSVIRIDLKYLARYLAS